MTEILLASGNLRAKSVNSAVLRTAAALAEGGMRTSEGLDTLPLQPDDDPGGGLVPPPVAELRRLADADAGDGGQGLSGPHMNGGTGSYTLARNQGEGSDRASGDTGTDGFEVIGTPTVRRAVRRCWARSPPASAAEDIVGHGAPRSRGARPGTHTTKRWRSTAAACLCLALAACGQSATQPRREPAPASRVVLSPAERQLWAPGSPTRATVPVLLYHDLGTEAFARQMTLLDHGGYQTITLDELVRFIKQQPVSLPRRPLLLTFDGGRLSSWTQSDEILRKLGFNTVLFVDVGRVEENDSAYLTWEELNRLQSSGRWDVQLQSGTGNFKIRYGSEPDDVGPFYAYRGSGELLGGWRERVFSDITYGEEQLAFRVRNYRPIAFAPPNGNYGQAATNDRRIPRQLLARLQQSFQLVFTQDRPGHATPAAPNPLGRIGITRETTEAQLRTLLEPR